MHGRLPYLNAFTSTVHALTRPRKPGLAHVRQVTTTTYPFDSVETEPSSSVPATSRSLDFRRGLDKLHYSLAASSSPSEVWSNYTTLLGVAGRERLPVEIHQQVLRHCSPPTSRLRTGSLRHLAVHFNKSGYHLHERRFQTIIRNIRACDAIPSIDDYHFILEQFAAVGHYTGITHVMKELTDLGLRPQAKTYGLCFQAIAHRLSLPVAKVRKSRLISQTREILDDLLKDMFARSVPLTAVNIDMIVRIMKETVDVQGFQYLMKRLYGIDLENPDCPPLDQLGISTDSSSPSVQDNVATQNNTPFPFSTAALNTLIDFLGRAGDISKLVQAFEVLTQPLPQTSQTLVSFDDDDDFGMSDSSFPVQTIPSPHTTPNTTTYSYLLRHICRLGHSVLARHYLLDALHLDVDTVRRLQLDATLVPFEEMHAPHFAINRAILLSVMGIANRQKDISLLRWLSQKIPKILKRKRNELALWRRMRDSHFYGPRIAIPSFNDSADDRLLSFSTVMRPALTRDEQTVNSESRRKKSDSVFDLDLDSVPLTPVPPPTKYFDVRLHIRVLKRDIEEIEDFSQRLLRVLGRLTQRLKERLGRRVWAGKNVYLATEGDRQLIDKEKWKEIVRFKPRPQTRRPRRKFSTRFIVRKRPRALTA